MLRRHIVLLIVIHPSDGDVKPDGPLGAFREEQAMSRHRVSSFPFLSSSSSHTTQLHYTNSYTYSHPNLNFLQHCTDTLPTRNVVCPSGAWLKNRPHLTPSIHLAWNPKCIIVQCVGIWNIQHAAPHLIPRRQCLAHSKQRNNSGMHIKLFPSTVHSGTILTILLCAGKFKVRYFLDRPRIFHIQINQLLTFFAECYEQEVIAC